jgi:hypothetical protein
MKELQSDHPDWFPRPTTTVATNPHNQPQREQAGKAVVDSKASDDSDDVDSFLIDPPTGPWQRLSTPASPSMASTDKPTTKAGGPVLFQQNEPGPAWQGPKDATWFASGPVDTGARVETPRGKLRSERYFIAQLTNLRKPTRLAVDVDRVFDRDGTRRHASSRGRTSLWPASVVSVPLRLVEMIFEFHIFV